mgnify:CR=1 FL=1
MNHKQHKTNKKAGILINRMETMCNIKPNKILPVMRQMNMFFIVRILNKGRTVFINL